MADETHGYRDREIDGNFQTELVALEIEERFIRLRATPESVTPEDLEWLLATAEELSHTVGFYANPDSYFAILIMPDRPAGSFADDFSYADHLAEYSEYDRQMPGKRARQTLGLESAEEQTKHKGDDDDG